MDKIDVSSIRVPAGGMKVYKDQCMYCFDSPESDGGLYICMSTFLGICPKHIKWHTNKTRKNAFLHMKKIKKPTAQESTTDTPPKKKPTRLAIGLEGGFDNTEKKVQLSIAAILAAQSSAYHQEVQAWDGEKRKVSKHADTLVQLDNGVKIPPKGWKCALCDKTDNLWLNLTDGSILCGRKYFDGSGGNNHALEAYRQTKYPLAVKLGTITPDGADVFSYDEDDMVEDPHLARHLAHFGINITQMEKTDKTMAELEIDINMRIREWDVIQSPLQSIKLVQRKPKQAVKKLSIFAFFLIRYGDLSEGILSSAPADPTSDFNSQMAKLADGMLSGRYSNPPQQDEKPPEEQDSQNIMVTLE
ncbi:Ubiquitin carboxyl-terminal hydrolase 5 [Exaiptasia diaphana]|nr:Ubiquitin carboxyl-terminal hydrolase 5 [Exaiptasia diaphana]